MTKINLAKLAELRGVINNRIEELRAAIADNNVVIKANTGMVVEFTEVDVVNPLVIMAQVNNNQLQLKVDNLSIVLQMTSIDLNGGLSRAYVLAGYQGYIEIAEDSSLINLLNGVGDSFGVDNIIEGSVTNSICCPGIFEVMAFIGVLLIGYAAIGDSSSDL